MMSTYTGYVLSNVDYMLSNGGIILALQGQSQSRWMASTAKPS